MKIPWKHSSPNSFGPRSRLKVAHVSCVRKMRKRSRFQSSRMKKIDEEFQKSLNIMRIVGVANQASMLQRAKQIVPRNGNILQSRPITRSEHPIPLVKSDGTSNHSRPMPQHMNQDLASKNVGVMNGPLGKLDKASTLRLNSNPNGALRPMALARPSKMKQSSASNLNCIKQSYSQVNHLKVMPGLIHNMKDRPNLDQRGTKGKHSEIGLNGCIGGTSDQNLRCEPLPKLEIPNDTSLSVPKKRRKGRNVDANDTGDCSLQRNDCDSTQCLHSDSGLVGCIGGTNDRNLRCGLLPEPETPDGIDLNMPKKRRKYIETNDDDDIGHQSNEDDYTRLPSHHANASPSSVSKYVAQQHDCLSKPIDESSWSGFFKVGSEKHVTLSGHLSTKSCKKVWNLPKSLQRVVEVTKVSRSEIWPKRWETSSPTSDNIGLYFFPYKMRPDNHLDQLLMEVIDNDLALRAVIDEAEMLIFSSSLLPVQYQTFQSKHYLWAVFRPRVVKGKHLDELWHKDNTAEAAAAATDATTSIPTIATAVATNTVAKPTEANHSRIDSSMGTEPGKVVTFVARQTLRVEQLIQEMKRDGALIVSIQGEMIAGDGSLPSRWHGGHNAASRSSS